MKEKYSRIFPMLLPLIKKKLVFFTILTQASTKKYLLQYGVLYLLAQGLFLVFALVTTYIAAESVIKNDTERRVGYKHRIEMVKEHPTVPDILYNAAVASVRLGQKKHADDYLEKALEIDPNFIDAQKLKEKIER